MEQGSRIRLAAVGERIKEARADAGLTQNDLAELVGVGMRQIQYYEAGESDPYRQALRIAEVTGKPVGWLLHGDRTSEEDEDALAAVASVDSRLKELAAAARDLAEAQDQILSRLEKIQAALEAGPAPQRARPRRKAAS